MNWILENATLLDLIVQTAQAAQVPPQVVLGIIEVESGGSPYAARLNPTYPFTMMQAARPAGCSADVERMFQKTAWGLMQLMGATAREMGFEGWLSELTVPETNIRLGVGFLGRKMSQYFERYGLPGVLAAYNGGAPRLRPDGRFVNQGCVDRVTEAAKRFEKHIVDIVSNSETVAPQGVAVSEQKKKRSSAAPKVSPADGAETQDGAGGA